MSTAGALVLALAVLGIPVALYVHAQVRPWKTCPKCGGSGRIRSTLVPGTHSDCKRCGAKGRVRRFGAGEGRS